MNKTFLCGSDNNLEDLLPWWYFNVKKHNPDIHVTVADFGLTHSGKHWAETNADKILKKGAKGKLPLAIQNAWNDEDNSYIRIGVEKTPKSFFLCLSLALNEEVSVIQNKIIEGIKTDCTQETFGYTSSQLEKIIKTEYINPKLFLGIAQNVMNVQIFLYAITKKFPKGDIVYPRTAFAYLTPLESFNRSIVIVIQEDIKIPQCELIIRTGKKEQKVFLPDDSLVTTCKNIVIRSSRVFRVNTENLS